MNLIALELVLLCLYPEVQLKSTRDGYWEKLPGWDDRWELGFTGPSAARGGVCYGFYSEGQDPVWLGNRELLNGDVRSEPLYYGPGTDYTGHISPSSATSSKLTVYHIMYKGKPLYGWFHLKLEVTDSKVLTMEQTFAQVETANDRYAVAGSFVRTKFTKGGCGTENAGNKYDYKPCQYAQDPFIQAHNTFLRRTPANNGLLAYQWNVKLDFPLCSIYYKENAVYFRVHSTQAKDKVYMHLPLQRHIQLQEFVYGAPDPEPPASADVTCQTEAENTTSTWVLGRGAPEINVTYWGIECTSEALYNYLPPKEPQYNWGGRCCMGYTEHLSQKSQYLVPRVTHRYNCYRASSDRRSPFKVPFKYVDFVPPLEPKPTDPEINDYLMQALAFATKNCSSVKCKETVSNQTREGVSADSTIGRYIFAGRQGHGILMVIACLFVYPLTNFVSRYFKGTFMSTRYIANLHPWYAVHIYGTLTTLTLLVTGVGMGIYAREYFGYSFDKAGRIHVLLGYVTCLLFLGGIVSNALRCGKKASGNCSIILHAFFGVLFYYLALVTIAVSVWIPASPGGQKLKHVKLIDKIINSSLVVVTLLFPIFEIIVHVIGTIQMCKRDVRFGVLRDWACFVAIPRVAAGEHHDEAGTGLKSILFVVYLLGASLATIISLVTIVTSDPYGHFFGKMTYTHMNGKLSTQNVPMHQEAEDVLE